MESRSPLESVRAAVAVLGSQIALAKLLGVTQPTVSGWAKGRQLPAEHVAKIEAATGISRYELRPDIFGPAPALAESADAGAMAPVQ